MKKLDRITLGKALAEARAKAGLTVREVEEQAGPSRSSVSRAERGHEEPYQNHETMTVLCDFFGIDSRHYLVPKRKGITTKSQDVSREYTRETNSKADEALHG